jgi:hypothetical protein
MTLPKSHVDAMYNVGKGATLETDAPLLYIFSAVSIFLNRDVLKA